MDEAFRRLPAEAERDYFTWNEGTYPLSGGRDCPPRPWDVRHDSSFSVDIKYGLPELNIVSWKQGGTFDYMTMQNRVSLKVGEDLKTVSDVYGYTNPDSSYRYAEWSAKELYAAPIDSFDLAQATQAINDFLAKADLVKAVFR